MVITGTKTALNCGNMNLAWREWKCRPRQALVLGLSLTLGEMDIFLETKPHKNNNPNVFFMH
jgi:hypothetical protein